ncbi:putative cytokinetic ring protein SteA [Alkalihalobacillus hemicellulosilyticus]|nr:putative cytokinetic ring protein SteA [Halalkalibacter hemicellulosilyticus]
MAEPIYGVLYEHQQTKKLLQYVPEESIVFLWHQDLDGVAVNGLIEGKVKAVINMYQSYSGTFQHPHVTSLLKAGIAVYDVKELHRPKAYTFNGEEMMIDQNGLYKIEGLKSYKVASLEVYDQQLLLEKDELARTHYSSRYEQFVLNTLNFANKEQVWFQTKPRLPHSLHVLKGKRVCVIARNTNYEKDIEVLRSLLNQKNLVIIAVDGAADGLLKKRIRPHFIFGDMDSISERAMFCGATLICHQHVNGDSPGKKRVDRLGLETELIQFVGTSEDVAIMAAYWSEASRIFLVGCRLGMEEFLEKGRPGMGATWLARIQAGTKITDLKGIHHIASSSLALDSVIAPKVERPTMLEFVRSFIQERFYAWKKKEVL